VRSVGHRVPWQLRNDGIPKSAMTIIAKDIGIVMDEARLNSFPLPMCGVAEQVFTSALGAGMAKEDDGRIVNLWQRYGGEPLLETGTEEEEIEKAKELDIQSTGIARKVLFVGLGTIGSAMALAVQESGVEVTGFDTESSAIDAFTKAGGKVCRDIASAASGAGLAVMTLNTAQQAEALLFGGDGTSGISTGTPNSVRIHLTRNLSPG